jgi:phosphoribosylformylglycinamidine (FGAM) synthase-like amidotransferase family enzyme
MARGDITTSFLSGQTNGKNILLTATTLGGAQTIHTVASGTTTVEFLTIEACNVNSAHATNGLWLLMGGTASPDDLIHIDLAHGDGAVVVQDKRLMQNGVIVKAYADNASGIVVYGYYQRYTL